MCHVTGPVIHGELARSWAITIFEQADQHFRVVETLTTRDFLDFRDRLTPASGFQSAQLREIEILLGLEDNARIQAGQGGSFRDALKLPNGELSVAARRVEARVVQGPSFKHSLDEWLLRIPIDGSHEPAAVDRFLRDYIGAIRAESRHRLQMAIDNQLAPEDVERLRERYEAADKNAELFLHAEEDQKADAATRAKRRAIRAAMIFIDSYGELPQLAWQREMLDSVLELEQSMVIWRQRHARMVERGKIIFMSSVDGGITHFPRFRAADGMSKAAVAFLGRQLAATLACTGIDVFTLCPGATDTPMFQASTLQGLSPEQRHALEASLPGGRLIESREIADLCFYRGFVESTGIFI